METEAALLAWINTFSLVEDVKSLRDLNDGCIIWDILRDIDPAYFTSSLPEGRSLPEKWIPKYENLKFIHRSLIAYISEDHREPLYTNTAGDGLQSIARDASAEPFINLFKLVLQATIVSPRHEEYILRMTALSLDAQLPLRDLIKEAETRELDYSDQHDEEVSKPATVTDTELQVEEQYAQKVAENQMLLEDKKELQEEIRSLDERLRRLQDNNDAIQQRLIESEDLQQRNGTVQNNNETRSMKALEAKIKQQENDFEDQELRLEKEQKKSDALQRKIENLETSSSTLARKNQKLQDELDEVKQDRSLLSKKANTAEKLRQQLQASSSLQKENESLKSQLEDYRREMNSFEMTRREKARLEIDVEEYKKLLPRIEEDNAELAGMKRQFELDNKALFEKYATASKQRKEDLATIADLRGRLQLNPEMPENGDLEDEMIEYQDSQSQYQITISSLEKSNQELELKCDERDAMIVNLQRSLDECNRIQKEATTDEMASGPSPQKDQDLETWRNFEQIKDITAKSPAELIKVEKNHNHLLDVAKRLEFDNDNSKAALTEDFDKRLSSLRARPELAEEIQKTRTAAGDESRSGQVAKAIDNYADMVIDGREKIAGLQKDEPEYQALVNNEPKGQLQLGKPDDLESSDEFKQPPVDLVTTLRNENVTLKRELKLMSSAFHDLGSRIQLSNVVLQRKSETPASWLGRQRRLVEGPLGRK
ncbi:MAG: hypothetical protein LQ351_008079 [Letrouitia transgressa]|nr:MAG: hypothetical protein LQ351_008079 [Letrouitia transgressa]